MSAARPTRFEPAGELTGVGSSRTAHQRRLDLRAALTSGESFVLPGVTDAMGARLVERAGFPAAYATGAGLANAQYGLPDLGLISLAEVVDHVGRITNAANIPLVVDADTGYGAPLSAMRTVRLLERAGAAGLQLEDQEMPKRCGHFESHAVIPQAHMQSKIAAAAEAREDDTLLIIARTDARSAYDIDEAIARAKGYVDAGADAIFVEAPRSIHELARVGQELAGVPLVVNVVEGGKTPQLSVAEYKHLGFTIVLYANFLLRAMLKAGEQALQHLHDQGESATYADKIATWQERQGLFNLTAFTAAEAHYEQPWSGGDQ